MERPGDWLPSGGPGQQRKGHFVSEILGKLKEKEEGSQTGVAREPLTPPQPD